MREGMHSKVSMSIKYTYLGQIVSFKKRQATDVETCVQNAWKTFCSLKEHLKESSHKINNKVHHLSRSVGGRTASHECTQRHA